MQGESLSGKDMLMDPGINVDDKRLTSDKRGLNPSKKGVQQVPPMASQIHQVEYGEIKKNPHYGEVGFDSDGENSSGKQLPSEIKNDSSGSGSKDNKGDGKDDGANYGGIQDDLSGNYLTSDSKNNNAFEELNNIGGIRTDEKDAVRKYSLKREIAHNLSQQQAIFTPARQTRGTTSSPLVVPNVGQEDPNKMLSSSSTIKDEILQIVTQNKRNKFNDGTDPIALPDQNPIEDINARPLAPLIHNGTVRINEERNERVRKIFDCGDETKGRLKNLDDKNVKDLLELSDKKPGLKGGFGEIYVSRKKVPGIDIQLVLKEVAIESDGVLKMQKLRSLTSEKLCTRAMHYGIVPLFGIHESSNNFYFLSPFMVNGNLNHAIEEDNSLIASGKPPKLGAFQRLRIMFQIASAIDFLHTPIPEIRGMIFHRDVTSLNIVLDEFLNARIIDFGLAREMKFGYDNTKTTRYYATPGYGKITQQQIIDRHDDYRCFGVVIRELLTGKKPFVEGCPEDDLMTQTEKKIRRQSLLKIWKDLEVEPPIKEPLLTLSSECIDTNKNMTSDKLVSELKKYLRNSNTLRWINRKQRKDVMHQGKGSKQTEKCDICLAYDAVEQGVLQHHDCDNHIHVCVSCMRNSYCNPIHCHSCDTKVTPTIGHNWAALLIAGYDKRNGVAETFKTDVKEIERVITSKCPLVMGVRTSNTQTVCLQEKGKQDNMLDKLKSSVEALKCIEGVQTLFVYYSGHYKPDEGGFELVNRKEGETGIQYEKQYLSAEELQKAISEILYGCELAMESTGTAKKSKRAIVLLDCCAGPAISPCSFGDASRDPKLPCFTLSANIRIVQINACRPDQGSVVQKGGSLFRKYLVQCFTREALGYKCLNEKCNRCTIQGDFITIEKLLEYLGYHLDNNTEMEQYDPVMNSYNVSQLDAKIGYVVNSKVDLTFKFKLDEKIRYHEISQLMFNELRQLKQLLFMKFVEKMELDKSIGDDPKLDTTEVYDMICIEVETVHQRDKITTLDQLMTAWNAKRELLVKLRRVSEICHGMVGIFLPIGQTVTPFLKYLKKSDHVKMAFYDDLTVAKVDIEENFENLLDDIENYKSLDKFESHLLDIDNAMKQDKTMTYNEKKITVAKVNIVENVEKLHDDTENDKSLDTFNGHIVDIDNAMRQDIKVKGQKPPAPMRGFKALDGGEVDDEDDDDNCDDDDDENTADLVPRNDIGFSQELKESLADKNWKVRGEGLQKIISILSEAKFLTGNLGYLSEDIKAWLGDNNKIMVTSIIGICTTLATKMGKHCKQHIKVIGPALINCLGDSKPALRAAAVGALNAWVDQTTLLPLAECKAFSYALKLENPYLRQELLGWLIERLPNHKQLPKDKMELCIPHLLCCLGNRNPDVRKNARKALVPFMIHIGYDSFLKATSELKPASKDHIMQIIEKAMENLPVKQPKEKPAEAAHVARKAPTPDYDEEDAPTPNGTAKEPGKTKAKPASAPSKRKEVAEDTCPAFSINEPKEKRFEEERNMKTLKWNFMEPRAEHVAQLRHQMEKNFNKTIIDLLFHSDFKNHIKAIDIFIMCMESAQDEQLANLDLILKWFTLRFFDTNPSILNKGLKYLSQIFKLLVDIDYNLHEFEANSFIPYLVIKVGHNKDNVRREVRSIFKLLYKVYPASKVFVFIYDGIKSKNFKQRTECLEELGYLIETFGISICQPSPQQTLKDIAGQISVRDYSVRNAALNTTVKAYLILGDNLYKYIGTLKEKDQSFLDERIKRTSKSKPAGGPSAAKQERSKSAPDLTLRANTQTQILRSFTGLPKSQSTIMMTKEFQLDIKDDSNKENYQMPHLIQQSDLNNIIQPVNLPNVKARPPSPGSKFFNNANTSNTVLDISQTGRDISTCVQDLSQEMEKGKELRIVFLCKTDETGKKIYRKNFIYYQLN